MELHEIKQIAEVDIYGSDERGEEKIINRALRHGWVLLSVAQRSPSQDQLHLARYILGNTDVNAAKPADIPYARFYDSNCGCRRGWVLDELTGYDDRCPKCLAAYEAQLVLYGE